MIARFQLALVRETTFPLRTPFFQRPTFQGNLPVPLGPLPAHPPGTGG
jgi:hypothetical protein